MFDLKDAFEYQIKLQRVLNNIDLPACDDELLGQFALALYAEMGEVLAANKNWKPWRNKSEYNKADLWEEIADVWIFLINLSMSCGMKSEDVLQEIKRKQTILSERLNKKEIG